MRKINRIVIHFTGGWSSQSTDSILNYWKKDLGWKQVGYHKLISSNGVIEDLAPLSTITNGVKGYNSDSIHICYKGGLKEITKDGKYIYGDTRTKQQENSIYQALEDVYKELKKYQEVDHITIVGHRDMSADKDGNNIITKDEWVKECPGFDVIPTYGWLCGHKGLKRLEKRETY